MKDLSHPQDSLKAAYGGQNWSPRMATHREEIGSLWGSCGLNSEWAPLKQVLLHPPGPELAQAADPEAAQLLETPDWQLAHRQHTALAQAYRIAGVAVHYVEPTQTPPPNLIFCADLFWMTPEGAILARPASTVRAGEERWVARRLADLGVPILRTLTGTATFEGADALWLDPQTVLLGRGLRTNNEGIRQVSAALNEIGVQAIPVDLPVGTMHLMGLLRILDRDLALTWPYHLAWRALEAI
jgi:arginine deiminase